MLVYQRVFLVKLFRGSSFFHPRKTWLQLIHQRFPTNWQWWNLNKILPKMGLPPVIIHCNGIFHHKPSSYWGISIIIIYIPFYGSPAWNATENFRLLALFPFLAFHGFGRRLPGIPVSWFLQPNCLSCCANCIKLPYIRCHPIIQFMIFQNVLIQFMIFLCKHLWLMIAGPLKCCSYRFWSSYKQTAASGHKCMSTRGWSKKRHTLW